LLRNNHTHYLLNTPVEVMSLKELHIKLWIKKWCPCNSRSCTGQVSLCFLC